MFKTHLRKLLRRWLFILFFVLLPLFYFGRKFFLLVREIYTEKSYMKTCLILKAENELMRRRIEEYQIGTIIEAKARDDLGMARENEKIYIINQ